MRVLNSDNVDDRAEIARILRFGMPFPVGSTIQDCVKLREHLGFGIVMPPLYVDKRDIPELTSGMFKGRPKASRRGSLTAKQLKEIRHSFKTSRELAKIYGVSHATICKARK